MQCLQNSLHSTKLASQPQAFCHQQPVTIFEASRTKFLLTQHPINTFGIYIHLIKVSSFIWCPKRSALVANAAALLYCISDDFFSFQTKKSLIIGGGGEKCGVSYTVREQRASKGRDKKEIHPSQYMPMSFRKFHYLAIFTGC